MYNEKVKQQYIDFNPNNNHQFEKVMSNYFGRAEEIEKRLKECCDIPIFHDDQHGTAVITLAGLMNALKVVGKNIEDIKSSNRRDFRF